MIRYKASDYPPFLQVVNIKAETEARVQLEAYSVVKSSPVGRYFETFSEAESYLLDRISAMNQAVAGRIGDYAHRYKVSVKLAIVTICEERRTYDRYKMARQVRQRKAER